MHKYVAEEEPDSHTLTLDDHTVTADTLSQTPATPNTQGDNENTILTCEKKNNSDALAETLKWLTINDAGYYESDLANKSDAKGDPASDPKVATNTSDRKKRKVTDTSNRYLQQKLLSNQTLLIITTRIHPRIDGRVATCGGTPHALTAPTAKGVITDTACRSARVLQNHRRIS